MARSKKHLSVCAIDPETLTWRHDIEKGDTAIICSNCIMALASREQQRLADKILVRSGTKVGDLVCTQKSSS